MLPAIHFQPTRMLLIACCLIVVLIPVLLVVRDVWNHNTQLATVATTLYTRPLPSATNEIDRRAYVADLGNGKACDYVAEQTLRTTLPRADILTYYHATNTPSTIPSNRTVAAPYAAQYYRISLNHQPVSLIIPSQQEVATALTFTLQVVDGRDDAGLDLRCY